MSIYTYYKHIYQRNGDKLKIINKNIQVSYNSQHGITNTHLKSHKDLIRDHFIIYPNIRKHCPNIRKTCIHSEPLLPTSNSIFCGYFLGFPSRLRDFQHSFGQSEHTNAF